MGVLSKKKKPSLIKTSKKSAKARTRNKSIRTANKFKSTAYNIANRYLPVSEAKSAFSRAPRSRKRINPMNAKAARRAATRVRSSINMLERLKKSLPHVSAKGKVTKRKSRR